MAFRDALPDYLKGYVTFAYKTGWKTEEIESLDWNHVDLKKGVAWIDPGKTKNDKGKTVYLDDELRDVLSRQWQKRKKAGILIQYVFPNSFGPNRIKYPYWHIRKACKQLGLNKILRDFRRTAIRNMVRSGTPERVAMQVSGHKAREVFERYSIVSHADLRLAAQRQEDYLNSENATISSTSGKIRILSDRKRW